MQLTVHAKFADQKRKRKERKKRIFTVKNFSTRNFHDSFFYKKTFFFMVFPHISTNTAEKKAGEVGKAGKVERIDGREIKTSLWVSRDGPFLVTIPM